MSVLNIFVCLFVLPVVSCSTSESVLSSLLGLASICESELDLLVADISSSKIAATALARMSGEDSGGAWDVEQGSGSDDLSGSAVVLGI